MSWLLAIVITVSFHPSQPRQLASAMQPEVASVRHAIAWQRGRTWHWQNVAGVAHSPTIRGVAHWHSLGFFHWVERRWNRRRLAAYKLAHRPRRVYRAVAAYSPSGSVPAIICSVFGPANCGFAKTIAWRESRYETWAANGQYLGLFQMGSGERAAYATIGYSTAYQQTVAAHNLFLARGWEPWTCCEG